MWNKLLQQVEESINVSLANSIRDIEATGQSIIKMQTGDPDFNTPDFICEASQQAMLSGETHYCASSGVSELKAAITQKLASQNKFTSPKSHHILVTQGAVHGLYLTLQTLLNYGDEVIIIAPYWMPYHSNIILAGAKPVVVKARAENDFIPSLNDIICAITQNTKAIIINSPNNPTGAVYSRDVLQSIGQHCFDKGIYIISDEVYEDLLYEDKHYSMQSILPNNPYIVTLFSFSKSYAMTGWRIGYLYGSKEFVAQANKLTQYITTSINSFVQAGAVSALTHQKSPESKQSILDLFSSRRELIINKISGTWLQHCIVIPKGAFYLFIDISSFSSNSMTFVKQLLEHEHIAFTPGLAFGVESDHCIRMTFASNEVDIIKALDILIRLK
ncbi:pyridoxal phosphate-dependent aminotransferase [Colwellia asteriadis]|uniref:Aminotransferase n=1 Tax=Colwellia asteriadis TaxID=517723 RepID=A0ABN1L641_9GAMM